jgi:hypothetical protein
MVGSFACASPSATMPEAMFKALRRNQPPFSTGEWIGIFILSDIPRIIGQLIAMRVGLGEWPAFVFGCIVMIASLLVYFWIRPELLGD